MRGSELGGTEGVDPQGCRQRAPRHPVALAGSHQGTLRDKVYHSRVLEGTWHAQGHAARSQGVGSPFIRAQRWGVWCFAGSFTIGYLEAYEWN